MSLYNVSLKWTSEFYMLCHNRFKNDANVNLFYISICPMKPIDHTLEVSKLESPLLVMWPEGYGLIKTYPHSQAILSSCFNVHYGPCSWCQSLECLVQTHVTTDPSHIVWILLSPTSTNKTTNKHKLKTSFVMYGYDNLWS